MLRIKFPSHSVQAPKMLGPERLNYCITFTVSARRKHLLQI